MEEYKPNSHKSKEESIKLPEKKEATEIKEVKVKKRTGFQKLVDLFVTDDSETIKKKIVTGVVVPVITKAITDIIKLGTDAIFGFDSSASSKKSLASKISYQKYYNGKNDEPSTDYVRLKKRYNYEDVIISDLDEVKEIFERMEELIAHFGFASVADLSEFMQVSCDHTENNYGWTDIRGAGYVKVDKGYKIKMPKALPINRV